MSKFISSSEIWDHVYESFGSPDNPKGKGKLVFKKDYGEMNIHQYNTGFGIKLFSIEGFFNEDVSLEATKSNDSNFLCLNHGSGIYMEDAIKKQKMKWDSGVCLSGEQYNGHKSNSIYQKNKEIKLSHLVFDKNLFQEIVCSTTNYNKAQSLYQGDYINVKFSNYINNKQKTLLDELSYVSNLHGNKLQELYLESKLLDLVYTSVNSMELHQQIRSNYLTQKDIECLYKAKDILLGNIMQPPSLKELAYKSATNEFKLKKGFKELFGTTVYGMLQEVRLEYAKNLLERNDINVQEAAHLVGYNNLSHFSKIFKNRYGKFPKELKNRIVLYNI